MANFWSALQTTDLAVWINFSRWAYAIVATAHVLAISVLIGSVLTLDLRLMGLARWIEPELLARLVVPVAGIAVFCAIISGSLLFIGRASEYAAFETFQLKIVLVICAIAMTLAVHRRYGIWLQWADARQRFRIGLASLLLWVSIAMAGRMIAFVHG